MIRSLAYLVVLVSFTLSCSRCKRMVKRVGRYGVRVARGKEV